jgi:hypothetical protein
MLPQVVPLWWCDGGSGMGCGELTRLGNPK